MRPRRSGDREAMNSLLELPLKVAAFAARTSVRLAEVAAEAASAWIRDRRRAHDGRLTPPPPPPPAPAPPPTPAAAELDEPPLAVVPDLTPGQAARIRAQQREAETTEDSPGAEVRVEEPWHGYGAMNAPEIIDRLRVSDDAVKAVVLLYERSHRARKTVLRAAGGG